METQVCHILADTITWKTFRTNILCDELVANHQIGHICFMQMNREIELKHLKGQTKNYTKTQHHLNALTRTTHARKNRQLYCVRLHLQMPIRSLRECHHII